MARGSGKPLLGSFVCCIPTKVVFGFDTVDSIGEEVKQLGRHALVIAAAKSMEKIGALGRVTRALEKAGVAVTVFQEVESDPTVTAIDDVSHLSGKRGAASSSVSAGGAPSILPRASP